MLFTLHFNSVNIARSTLAGTLVRNRSRETQLHSPGLQIRQLNIHTYIEREREKESESESESVTNVLPILTRVSEVEKDTAFRADGSTNSRPESAIEGCRSADDLIEDTQS